ncbi:MULTISPECIES: hypothetical protein [Halorussus]|uniref:hypothetical protein n=1 Tax=Halorussus TaxID=1070314 RepID=UPI00209FB932|nr:hypothetical protein [Halorussus vallis]USZ77535.1 hypothetical protein NGM07_09405 [Halorussus vallis]
MTQILRRLADRPGLAFGLAGATFTVLYLFVRPVEEFASFFVGEREAFLLGPLLVVASALSAFAVGTALWRRFAGERAADSRWRPAVVGALVGTLSMPPTMLALTVGRYLVVGLPDDLVVGSPPPGATHWVSATDLVLQDAVMTLYVSLFGFVLTGGSTVIVGAATGEVLRRLAAASDSDTMITER